MTSSSISSNISLSPKFSKKDPDLNLTSYLDLSKTKFADKIFSLILKSKVIGWEISFIVKTLLSFKKT